MVGSDLTSTIDHPFPIVADVKVVDFWLSFMHSYDPGVRCSPGEDSVCVVGPVLALCDEYGCHTAKRAIFYDLQVTCTYYWNIFVTASQQDQLNLVRYAIAYFPLEEALVGEEETLILGSFTHSRTLQVSQTYFHLGLLKVIMNCGGNMDRQLVEENCAKFAGLFQTVYVEEDWA